MSGRRAVPLLVTFDDDPGIGGFGWTDTEIVRLLQNALNEGPSHLRPDVTAVELHTSWPTSAGDCA